MQKLPRLRMFDVPLRDVAIAFFEPALLHLDALTSRAVSPKCEQNFFLVGRREQVGAGRHPYPHACRTCVGSIDNKLGELLNFRNRGGLFATLNHVSMVQIDNPTPTKASFLRRVRGGTFIVVFILRVVRGVRIACCAYCGF